MNFSYQTQFHTVEKTQKIKELIDYSKGALIILNSVHLENVSSYISESKLSMISSNEWVFFANVLVGKTDSLYIAVPYAFYTIPTRVSAASISYDHKNITEFGMKYKNPPQELVEFLSDFCDEIRNVTGGMSFHKHPSKSSFSGTFGDASKSAINPGILFRTQNANNVLISDFVFYAENKQQVKICDVDCKIVNVKPNDVHFAEGEYTYLPTITAIRKTVTGVFGIPITDSVFELYQIITRNIDFYSYDFVQDILESYQDFDPVYAVFDEHFEQALQHYTFQSNTPIKNFNNDDLKKLVQKLEEGWL